MVHIVNSKSAINAKTLGDKSIKVEVSMNTSQQNEIRATIKLLTNLLKYTEMNRSYELAVKNQLSNLTALLK